MQPTTARASLEIPRLDTPASSKGRHGAACAQCGQWRFVELPCPACDRDSFREAVRLDPAGFDSDLGWIAKLGDPELDRIVGPRQAALRMEEAAGRRARGDWRRSLETSKGWNVLAIIAIVLAPLGIWLSDVTGFLGAAPIGCILGIVVAHIASWQLKWRRGHGLAVAAKVISYVGLILLVWLPLISNLFHSPLITIPGLIRSIFG